MISEYDAGWLVDPMDDGAVAATLDEVIGDPEAVRRKTENARALASEVLDPAEAVRPLVKILEEL
jgi:tRNA C32,U32 (ribose-2'-O)-methylase TrmJ